MKYLILIFSLFFSYNLYSQCACVYTDESGVEQCVFYPNCGGNPSAEEQCESYTTDGLWCSVGPDCFNYSGNPGCDPQCLPNNACFYQGQNCDPTNVCSVVLPISLISLEGESMGDYNLITWQTASEQNNDYFVVQKSIDGEEWQTLVYINGNGNSSQTIYYEFRDMTQEKELSYYRLIQVDFNGESTSYGPISIDNRVKDKRTLVKQCNLMGQEVDDNYRGFVILYYDNGDVEKVLR